MEEVLKRKVDKFFIENKDLKYSEFISKFEEEIGSNLDKTIYLLKLYKKEKNLLILEVKKDKSSFTKKQIIRNNQITDYLEKKVLILKSKKKKKKEIEKSEKNKKVNNKIKLTRKKHEFSTYISKLKVDLENKNHFIFFSLDETNQLIYYLLEDKENLLLEATDITSKKEIDKIINKVSKISNLVDRLKKYRSYLIEKENNLSKFPIAKQQIENLDFIYHMDTISIIEQIVNSDEKDDKIEKLINIYQLKLEEEKTLINGLISKKRKIINQEKNKKTIEIYNELISESNGYINLLNSLINYLAHLKKNDKNEICKVKFKNEINLTGNQISIEAKMINREKIENCDLKDYLYSFGHFVKYQNLIDSNILEYTKDISELCFKDNLDDEIDAIYYIWDAIKYRLSNTDKEDKVTRKILKDIRIIFDFVIKNYQDQNQIQKHDYHFDLIDYFLNDEEGYLYLEKLVKISPKFVNVYHLNNNEKEHILIYILKKYIYNYQMMLDDKTSDYINKDYLRSIYLLYLHSDFLTLSSEEKNKINEIIKNFEKNVKKNITSSRRKYSILNDLVNMNIDHIYVAEEKNLLREIDIDRLDNQINSLFMKIDTASKSKKRKEITEDVIISSNKYVAYSFSKEDKYIIKMHVLDLYDIIVRGTLLDSYMYNCTLEKKELDSFLVSKLKLEVGKIYPTITYQITKDKDNIRIEIYQSKITPTKEEILPFEMDINYEINNVIKEYFEEINLPLIYTGVNNDVENKFIEIMNNISHILNRFDREEFNNIYHLLNGKIDNYHYSMNEIDGVYSFNIENPTLYPGLTMQRLIHELIIENKNTEEENIMMIKQYKDLMEQIVADYNQFNHYVDSKKLKDTKGKLPKVIKRINW